MKECGSCSQNFPLSKVYLIRHIEGRTYRAGVCRKCWTERQRTYRRRNGQLGGGPKRSVGEAIRVALEVKTERKLLERLAEITSVYLHGETLRHHCGTALAVSVMPGARDELSCFCLTCQESVYVRKEMLGRIRQWGE